MKFKSFDFEHFVWGYKCRNRVTMAEGLPNPHMDWTCSNLPDSLEKFERHCCLMFDGPLKGKSKKELSAYVLLWIGDKGHMIHASRDLTDDENRDPSTIFKRVRKV